jgi:hypothetical protein
MKIPLFTYYSASHEVLFERFFYPSYLEHLSGDFDLTVVKGDQLCSGSYKQTNWNLQMRERAIYLNEFIQTTQSKYFLFSDVDILFYKNVKDELLEEIKGFDLIMQDDSFEEMPNNLCAGFFFCRINKTTRAFFKRMTREYFDELDDQQNFNLHLIQGNKIRYKPLSRRFYNLRFWHPGNEIRYPDFPIVMYHANFTIGIVNKLYLLENFKKIKIS